jgi:SAM-dependent methyltransferase
MLRCEEQELADAPDMPEEMLARSYREMQWVHDRLGNTRAVLRLLKVGGTGGHALRRVLDVGCGQGALLATIRERLHVEVVGLDLRPAPAESSVPILTGNAVTDVLPAADVAVCVVMAHHLTESELEALIQNVGRSCERFILLDLVRHPMPLMLFRMFVAPLLDRVNALDGQTSIRRAYTVAEMRGIVDGALAGLKRPVLRMRHTVSPLWIRQVVDISWGAASG